jgi:hypothetical protein
MIETDNLNLNMRFIDALCPPALLFLLFVHRKKLRRFFLFPAGEIFFVAGAILFIIYNTHCHASKASACSRHRLPAMTDQALHCYIYENDFFPQ